MSDLIQNLSNVPLDVTDPKFIFGSVLTEHKSIVTKLQALQQLNNSLMRDNLLAEYNFSEAKYNDLYFKMSILEVMSQLQPNISNFPTNIDKADFISSLINLGKTISDNEEDVFLNISESFVNDATDIKTLDVDIDKEFLELLPPSVVSLIVDVAYTANDDSTVKMPTDVMMGIINNLFKVKKDSMIESFGTSYYDFVLPFMDYQSFLEENEISTYIDRLILIERFFLETKIFNIPFSVLKYSNEYLFSDYFKTVFFIKNTSDIYFKKMFTDNLFATRAEEVITRVLSFINNTGETDTTVNKKTFEGLNTDVDELMII